MKTGLLFKETLQGRKNIGDYIQSLAAKQFFNKIDNLIPQEYVNSLDVLEEPTKVIMNGWFMTHSENWPPNKYISPLFISFHITPSAYLTMLDSKGVKYLKMYEPIGCRDNDTVEVLKEKGISAYFSGCLTLTLGLKYKNPVKSGEIIFVDPFYEFHRNKKRKVSILPILNAIPTLLFNRKSVLKIAMHFEYQSILKKKYTFLRNIEKLLRSACFYRVYKTKFTDELLYNAIFITHIQEPSPVDMSKSRFKIAENLLHRYAKASLVITSRIHAALPCLGLETPVLFVTPDKSYKNEKGHSGGRFDGLATLFRTLICESNGLLSNDELLNSISKIDKGTVIPNKRDYEKYKEQLIKKCSEFVAYL